MPNMTTAGPGTGIVHYRGTLQAEQRNTASSRRQSTGGFPDHGEAVGCAPGNNGPGPTRGKPLPRHVIRLGQAPRDGPEPPPANLPTQPGLLRGTPTSPSEPVGQGLVRVLQAAGTTFPGGRRRWQGSSPPAFNGECHGRMQTSWALSMLGDVNNRFGTNQRH